MTTRPEPDREREIFEQALEIQSAEERSGFVKGACGPDAELRTRVEALLRAHEQAEGFLPETPQDPSTDLAERATEKQGERVGRYKLLQKIGEGGCGVVYMAEQEEPVHRRVALKVIKLGMDTKTVIARFEAERQVLALMDHPNIAKVLDAGASATGRPYFVMELVRGIKITDYCDQNNLPTVERLNLFIQVCHAVQHAHQKGIIHRDIKPSNILVTQQDGVPIPKVIDFGIAKATTDQRLTDKTLFTAFEQFIGTPAYMSPEQAEMSSLDIDTRSDIYSLGVLLYELLTGKTPFDAKELLAAGFDEMRRIIREQEPARPSTRVSTMAGQELTATARHRQASGLKLASLLRGDLDWIVMNCLEKDRRRRYETANNLATDLQRHLNNEPVLARPPTTAYRMQKFAQRNRVMVAAGSAVAMALVLGTVVSAWQAVRATRATGEAVEARNREREQRRLAVDSAEESRQRLMQLNTANGLRALSEGDLVRSTPWLIEALQLENPNQPRDEMQRRRLSAIFEQWPKLRQMWFHERPVTWAAFSPDGRRIVTATGQPSEYPYMKLERLGQGDARLWDADSGQPIGNTMVHGGSVLVTAFSADGQKILTAGSDNQARLWDANSGQPLAAPLAHHDNLSTAVFSPDSQRVATASNDKTARIWDAATGQPLTPPLAHAERVLDASFSPDGGRLATGAADSSVHLWDVSTGQRLLEFKKHQSYVNSVSFSPDGQRLLTASSDNSARVWNAKTGEPLTPPLLGINLWRAEFSPDGRNVAASGYGSTVQLWDAATGRTNRVLIRHEGPVLHATFSPDGLRLITASRDKVARVWDVNSGQPMTPPLAHGDQVIHAAFSPDGHRFVTASADGIARLWDMARADSGVRLQLTDGSSVASVSPDGSKILALSASNSLAIDAQTGQAIEQLEKHNRAVNAGVFSSDGRWWVTASQDNTARVWETKTGQPMTPPLKHQEGVLYATFSPDAQRVATASYDQTARIWDLKTGQPVTPPLQHSREVTHLCFSPDGLRLMTACRDRTARVWDAKQGTLLQTLSGHADWVTHAFYSPDGQRLLTVDRRGNARLWNAFSGDDIASFLCVLRGDRNPFSADGRRLVALSSKAARVLDALSGQPITPPLEHQQNPIDAAFNHAGTLLLTIEPQAFHLWNAASGQAVSPPLKPRMFVRQAVFAKDDKTLLLVGHQRAWRWKLPNNNWPVDDLAAFSELLSGHRVDESGGVSLVKPDALQAAWAQLRDKYPSAFVSSPEEIRAWHQKEAGLAEQFGLPFAAVVHLDRLSKAEPADQAVQERRTRLRAQIGQPASRAPARDPFLEAVRNRFSPRDPETPARLLDLSDHYNYSLTEGELNDEWNSLWSLPRGRPTLGEVPFDIRAYVQIQGAQMKTMWPYFPEKVQGIKVGLKCQKLHFLHGTKWSESEEKIVGKYIANYDDGEKEEIPIRYGPDVRNFWLKASDPPENPNAVVAWKGTNALTSENGISFRLYKTEWTNSRPEASIRSLDYVSTMTDCAPFLVAITAE